MSDKKLNTTDVETNEVDKEEEIDILELIVALWKQRRKLIIWSCCGAILGLIIGFSIPKEYTTEVKLAPESNEGGDGAGGIGALAAMAGFSLGGNGGNDAVYPLLYPDVVSSIPFITGLFDVEVPVDEGEKMIPLKVYMKDDIKGPWWGTVLGLPWKVLGLFSSKEEEEDKPLDNFHLTREQTALVNVIRSRISTSVDNKTSVVSISVEMQDPLVSAVLADTVVARLQEYITNYRTNKARQDLAYAQKLNSEAKENYYKAQQTYAEYLDRNQGALLHSVQTVRDRLANEASLAFNLYNQTAQQVQLAQAKVQETTPVYAIVSPATVPVRASSPRKMLILIGFTFIAFVACAAWILFGEKWFAQFRKDAKDGAQQPEAAKEQAD